ncbi:MAG: DUF3179 domain-containing protein [Thermodesulfobacteriota bacterium]
MKYIFLILALLLSVPEYSMAKNDSDPDLPGKFIELLISGDADKIEALKYIEKNWQPTFAVMMLETIYLSKDPSFTVEYIKLLEEKTGQGFGFNIDDWYQWIWSRDYITDPNYADFKSLLYSLIDIRFAEYFSSNLPSKIRLDEVRWGGVKQDGIPPLRNPKMIFSGEADYLKDNNVVFGLEVNGDARAYPKRIMGWHEMFVDTVGGVPVAGVYCTLCGSMILYHTEIDGINHELGTSGFLYRSNKLMYDKETQSLWNTLWGRPVIGKLVDDNIELERMSVVTTTWGEWKKRHPETKVLSLDTGYTRNYDEGAAYKQYFATDDLMFIVPKLDKRLKNKDEVLGLIFSQYPNMPLAISARFLSKRRLYQDKIENMTFVVVTDRSGASRVYESKEIKFIDWDQKDTVIDSKGKKWILSESRLQSPAGDELFRLPAHKAFWFGWYSAYSNTRLVH